MKILILGASGFIGKNLLLRIYKDFETTAIYFNSKDFLNFININNINVKAIKCDLSDKIEILNSQIEKEYDVVISLVANQKPSESFIDPLYDFKNNALSIYNVLFNVSAKKVIYFSSGLVYEDYINAVNPKDTLLNPTIPYAISKFSAEQFVKLAKKKGNIGSYCIARFWGAYGPYQSTNKIYSKLVKTFGIEKNSDFTIKGDGHSLIDAMYVDDTVNAIIEMINQKDDIIFDFSPKRPISIFDLVMRSAKLFCIEPRIKFEGESYETIDFYSNDYNSSAYLDNFTSLEEGLLKLFNWQKTHRELL